MSSLEERVRLAPCTSSLALFAFAAALAAPAVHAQVFPAKVVRIIVPTAAGGSIDFVARLIGQELNKAWSQGVIVDNRAGAGGTIGVDIVAKAPPDGHTIAFVPNEFVTSAGVYAKLPYDPLRDLAPVTQLAFSTWIMVVNPSLPVRSIKELIALAKAKPAQINYASTGNGTGTHLAAELFKSIAGIDMVHIPYKGTVPALTDVIAGQVGLTVTGLAAGMPHVKSGKLNTNLMGTATIFECARLAGIRHVIFPSSKMVYGPVAEKHRHPTYEPVPEEHPREPEDHYGNLKRACEALGTHYAQLYGLDIVALRSASVFGPGKFALHTRVSPVIALIEAAIANRPFRIASGADQSDEMCYTRDCANSVIAALDSAACPGKFRAYNISSGELISLRGMIAVLKELYPHWECETGPGLDYRGYGVPYYFRMATQKAQAELGFKAMFDFRRSVIDYADTLARLKNPAPTSLAS